MSSDPESTALYRRAGELAVGIGDETAARDELIRIAGGRQRTLVRAEKKSRLGRHHLESEPGYHVHRLLYAALHNEPVAPASDDVLTSIATINQVLARDRPDDEIWASLCTTEPRLIDLLAQARGGRFGPAYAAAVQPAAHQDERREAFESNHGWLGLGVELKKVVGPQSGQSDAVLISECAHNLAHRYLANQRPQRRHAPVAKPGSRAAAPERRNHPSTT